MKYFWPTFIFGLLGALIGVLLAPLRVINII